MANAPLDHLRSRKKQVYLDVPIPDDGQYLTARDEARSKYMQIDLQSKMGRARGDIPADLQAEIDEAKDKLQEAEEALKPHLIWFRATSLPPKQYDKLVSNHPPTDEQRKQAKKDGITGLAYNTETFLLDLVTRCVAYAYTVDEDGELANAYPDEKGKFGDDVQFELITSEFLDEMQEEGNWANGEIMLLCEAAANVNQNIRRVGTLGNV